MNLETCSAKEAVAEMRKYPEQHMSGAALRDALINALNRIDALERRLSNQALVDGPSYSYSKHDVRPDTVVLPITPDRQPVKEREL